MTESEVEELPIKTSESFAKEVEEIVWMEDCSYMDAILKYCSDNDLEIETVAEVVKKNGNLKALVYEDAEKLNYVRKVTRLPI